MLLAEGRTYAVSDVLTLSVPGAVLTGGGTLLATDEERSSLTIAADDVVVQDVTLTIEDTSRRFDAFEQQRLYLDGHSGIVVRDVTVEGSAAAGIYVYGTTDFLLEGVQVSGTEADGVHITGGASDGRVLRPVVRDVGDDGVAVVSYAQDGGPSDDIRVESPVVDGTDARGVSVVGGTNITYTDITVSGTAAAGVYVAAEGSFDTTSGEGVRIEGGTVTDANTDDGHRPRRGAGLQRRRRPVGRGRDHLTASRCRTPGRRQPLAGRGRGRRHRVGHLGVRHRPGRRRPGRRVRQQRGRRRRHPDRHHAGRGRLPDREGGR